MIDSFLIFNKLIHKLIILMRNDICLDKTSRFTLCALYHIFVACHVIHIDNLPVSLIFFRYAAEHLALIEEFSVLESEPLCYGFLIL